MRRTEKDFFRHLRWESEMVAGEIGVAWSRPRVLLASTSPLLLLLQQQLVNILKKQCDDWCEDGELVNLHAADPALQLLRSLLR